MSDLFIADVPLIITWYLALSVLGWIFVPLASRMFPWFVDHGYAFAKIVGVLLIGYSVWFLASLHIAPFTVSTIYIVAGIWLLINLNILRTQALADDTMSLSQRIAARIFSRTKPARWKLIIFEELLFLAMIMFWAYIRGHEPSIRGLEKFMDYGFMNSILNSPYFPPQDMWLSPSADPRYTQGFAINYYYFGHYISAFLIRFSRLPSEVGYNLMLSTIFAFSVVQTFSIGLNLIMRAVTSSAQGLKDKAVSLRDFMAGLLAAFLVSLAGNLHTIYIFTKGYPNETPVPFWTIFEFSNTSNYWYPNATRFIPNTIHEFPSYSWVVADLHGHVLDIPFVLLTLAVLLSVFASFGRKFAEKEAKEEKHLDKREFSLGIVKLSFDTTILNQVQTNLLTAGIQAQGVSILHVIFLGFIASVMYMTNAWDGLIYLALSTLTFTLIALRAGVLSKEAFNLKTMITNSLVLLGLMILSFIAFGLPFNSSFRPFVSGFGVVGGWEMLKSMGMSTMPDVLRFGPFLFEKGNSLRSPFWMLAVLWGFFYINVFILLIYFGKQIREKKPGIIESFRIWISTPSSNQTFSQKMIRYIHHVIEIITNRLSVTDVFALMLIFLSTLLLTFPEFFYAKDIYPAHYRANTMFKLGYQAYIMLSLVSMYSIVMIRNHFRSSPHSFSIGKTLLNLFTGALLILVGIYPYFAIESYYGVGKTRSYEGQDGLVWIKNTFPGDYEAIYWLRDQIAFGGSSVLGDSTDNQYQSTNNRKPVILEAVGESYTDYSRISAYTGITTPLGWPVHEWLWRGSYDEPGRRVEEVRAVYEATEPETIRLFLTKYHVDYIVIGDLERQKYPNINEELLVSMGTTVFTSEGTTIVEVK